jgi:hypothetical protein
MIISFKESFAYTITQKRSDFKTGMVAREGKWPGK